MHFGLEQGIDRRSLKRTSIFAKRAGLDHELIIQETCIVDDLKRVGRRSVRRS